MAGFLPVCNPVQNVKLMRAVGANDKGKVFFKDIKIRIDNYLYYVKIPPIKYFTNLLHQQGCSLRQIAGSFCPVKNTLQGG